MHVSAAFHASDVCVGKQTIPEDISPNVATMKRRCARACAACASFVRREKRESKVIDERKMTHANKECLT